MWIFIVSNVLLIAYPVCNNKLTSMLQKYYLLPINNIAPIKGNNIKEIGNMYNLIRKYSEDGKKKVYVNSSSILLNDSILVNYNKSINNKFSNEDYYVYPVHVDERDGVPEGIKDTEIVVVSSPSQYHLNKEHQKMITFINDVFFNNKYISNYYEKVKEVKIDNVDFYIYRKNEQYNEEEFENDYQLFIEECKKILNEQA